MNKGERTRLAILQQSLIYASQFGLADITIGRVSKLCELSRTGVISHFKNKEDMQIAILEYGETLFTERVIAPARQSDALKHLTRLLECWTDWVGQMYTEHQVSCPFIKAVVEFQNRPASNVRTFALNQQNRLIDYLTHRINRCIEQKQFSPDTDSATAAYELYSLYLGHAIIKHSKPHSTSKFNQSITRLIEQYRHHV